MEKARLKLVPGKSGCIGCIYEDEDECPGFEDIVNCTIEVEDGPDVSGIFIEEA